MPTRRHLIGAGAATVALAGVAASPLRTLAQDATPAAGADDGEQNSANPVLGTPTLQPAIDIIRAQEIALEGNAGAVVTGVDLDGDDGVLTYSVALDNGLEVDVDATTGAVIKTEPENGNGDDDDNGNSNDGNDDNGDDGAQDDGDDDTENDDGDNGESDDGDSGNGNGNGDDDDDDTGNGDNSNDDDGNGDDSEGDN